MMKRLVAAAAATALGLALIVVPTPALATAKAAPLTNLAHLDFLTTSVTPAAQARHTTYELAAHPSIGTLWVYATHNSDGSYTRVGGGDFDSATGTYSQGAFDADDIARAAVVYLRHWRQFHDSHSRAEAYALLRGLTYLQTATGANRGDVVLWMQPDGTLTPSALPKEEPDPSDSANSYWLARTIWALGEGYQAFAGKDAGFAKFLRARMDLAVGALRRDSLSRYGQFQHADGARTPKWLIVGGADASAEAVLGLAAFVQAGGREARPALRKLAVGIADLGSASGPSWPYGAILPSATSRSMWHPWASMTPAALSVASTALHRPKLAAPAIADADGFTPDLLTRYGPINGLTPAPTDQSQIAYGVDSRVQSLLATAKVTHSAKLRRLAGVYAGWFFGQNKAGTPMYNPATGVTYDGISADGVVNQNSGAESTIHGLLSMLALDAAPAVARIAHASKHLEHRAGTTTVEGEAAATTGAASVATANPASTAESAWSQGQYLQVTGPATANWTVAPSGRARIVEAVVDRVPGHAANARFAQLGTVAFGGGGKQGTSAVRGELVPVVVGILPAGETTIRAHFTGGRAGLDALLLTPVISVLRTAHVAVISNNTAHARTARVTGFRAVTVAANGFRVVRR
jgi:hypothetical protein